jgi:hypothetical protein
MVSTMSTLSKQRESSRRVPYQPGQVVGNHGCKYLEEAAPSYATRGNGKSIPRRRALFECGGCCAKWEAILEKVKRDKIKTCGCGYRTIGGLSSREAENFRIYKLWTEIKQRCYNENNAGYKTYGGRGIFVCNEWRESFLVFYEWALTHGYRKDLNLDRIDKSKGYSPSNCRFATPKENSDNRRVRHDARYCLVNGERMTFSEAVKKVPELTSRSLHIWASGKSKKNKPDNVIIIPRAVNP